MSVLFSRNKLNKYSKERKKKKVISISSLATFFSLLISLFCFMKTEQNKVQEETRAKMKLG